MQLTPISLLDLLNDRHRPDDEELPDTGVSLDWERVLSPIFISGEDYGTRSSTVLLIGNGTGISMTEKGYLDGHGRTSMLADVIFQKLDHEFPREARNDCIIRTRIHAGICEI